MADSLVLSPVGGTEVKVLASEKDAHVKFNMKLAGEVIESWPEKKAGYRGLLFYCFFLALYILIQMMQLDPENTYVVNTVFRQLVDGYDGVQTQSDLYTYMENLSQGIFANTWYNGDSFSAADTGFITYYNKLVGGVQIVQTRGVIGNCSDGLYKNFYGSCHTGELDTSAYGPNGTFTYSSDVGGHVLFLSVANSLDEVTALVAKYKAGLWLDKQTRSVQIKFAAYNGEMELFTFVIIDFTFGESGFMFGRNVADIQSARFELYKSTKDYVRLALELVWLYLVAWTTADEIIDFVTTVFVEKKGLRGYFSSVWNYMDMANLGLLFAYVAFRVKYVTFIFDHPIPLPSNKYVTTLEEAANIQSTLLLINALNIFEKIVHLFKFFQFQERMNILNQTMALAVSDLVHFFILFFLIFLGYASMTMILFGPHLENYSSFGRTIESLGEIILGNFDFSSMFEIDPLMSAISFWSFIMLVFFILVNVFLAILIDSYAEAKNSSDREGFSAPGINEDMNLWITEAMSVLRGGKVKKNERTTEVVRKTIQYFIAKNIESVTKDDLKWYMSEVLKVGEQSQNGAMAIFDVLPGRSDVEQVEVHINALLKHYWVKADKDGSGYLDRAEFIEFLRFAPIKFAEKDIEQIVTETDTNGDGRISYDEFIPVCHRIMLQSVRE